MIKIHVFLIIVLSNIYCSNFFPTGSDINSSSTFDINANETNGREGIFARHDFNYSSTTEVDINLTESSTSIFGIDSFDTDDKNLSKSEDLKSYVDAFRPSLKGKVNVLYDAFRQNLNKDTNKTINLDPSNIESFSSDKLKEDNTSIYAKAITDYEQAYNYISSKFSNLQSIDCYITRKLTNSYFCPLSGLSNSYFIGGNIRDGKDESKKKCENSCVLPQTCLSKDMDKNKVLEQSYTNKDISSPLEVTSDILMLPKKLTFTTNNYYLYDSNISIMSSDYNSTLAKEELVKKDFKLYFDVNYINKDGEEKNILKRQILTIDETQSEASIYLNRVYKTDKYIIKFYTPFSSTSNQVDSKITILIDNTKLEFVDNKYWFCPAINIVEKVEDCDGVIKNTTIGSENFKICVTEEREENEPIYGAFYSRGSCENACKIRSECLPTYRHLTSFKTLETDSSIRDVEIGCVDNPNNSTCTVEKCRNFFLEDKFPTIEKTWTSDDQVKVIIANGIQRDDTIRPRINVAEDLSSNGDVTSQKLSSLKEMVDMSYYNMIERNTYDVSEEAIKENIPKKLAYNLLGASSTEKSLQLLLKADSFDIDEVSDYYIYILFKLVAEYTPYYGSYTTSEGVQSGSTDTKIKIRDEIYLLKTNSGYKTIQYVNNKEGAFKTTVCKDEIDSNTGDTYTVCNDEYKFAPMTAYYNNEVKTYDSNTKEFLSYDIQSDADYFTISKFSSDNIYNKYIAYNKLSDILDKEGVLFQSQESQNRGRSFKKVYDGNVDLLQKANLQNIEAFALYSKTKLSYSQILQQYKKENMFFSLIDSLPTSIPSDGVANNNKVKFNIAGKPDSLSANITLNPDSNEEGKKAFIFMLLY